MNIAIAKVLIQAFVNEHELLQLPGSHEEQFSEVYSAAQDEEEDGDEILILLDWIATSKNIGILFRGKKFETTG